MGKSDSVKINGQNVTEKEVTTPRVEYAYSAWEKIAIEVAQEILHKKNTPKLLKHTSAGRFNI